MLKQANDLLFQQEFLLEVAKGNVPGHSIVNKFGRFSSLSTSIAPITSAGVYQTPEAAVSLEFVSGSADDALDSTGMHELTVVGLDANCALQTVVTAAHATDGTIAVTISGTWLRVFRAWVSKSGAYANASTPSHLGAITIRVASAGATYAQISLDGSFGLGQTLIGAYTVPANYTCFMLNKAFSSDVSGVKTCNFYFFQRSNIDDVSSPYSGTLRVQHLHVGTQGLNAISRRSFEKFSEKTDIGFMGKASATTDASVEFELLQIQNDYL